MQFCLIMFSYSCVVLFVVNDPGKNNVWRTELNKNRIMNFSLLRELPGFDFKTTVYVSVIWYVFNFIETNSGNFVVQRLIFFSYFWVKILIGCRFEITKKITNKFTIFRDFPRTPLRLFQNCNLIQF